MEHPRILLVDDDAEALASMFRAITCFEPHYELHTATTVGAAATKAATLHPAVAIIDLSIDQGLGVESGFSLLDKLFALDRATRIIVLTGHGSGANGRRALQRGAAHFMLKPARIEHLLALIRDGVQQYDLRRDAYASPLNTRPAQSIDHRSFPGKSRIACRIRDELQFAAMHDQAVLITGETGTGKGWCSRLIHNLSPRASRPYVTYQPMAYSPDLISSDLFGHERGAFTGAAERRAGLIRTAHQGTLFLDEVIDLPPAVQVMLLHALQEKRYRRLGSDLSEESDFRLLCATNGDVERAMSARTFRSDLYFRICQLRIHLPPLRERCEDIPEIAQNFLSRLSGNSTPSPTRLSDSALDRIHGHAWPGNLRELEGVLQHALFRARWAQREVIAPEDILFPGTQSAALPVTESGSLRDAIQQLEQQRVLEALSRLRGNQLQAAKALGIDRGTLKRILKRATMNGSNCYEFGSEDSPA